MGGQEYNLLQTLLRQTPEVPVRDGGEHMKGKA